MVWQGSFGRCELSFEPFLFYHKTPDFIGVFMNKASEKRLSEVHPTLARKIRALERTLLTKGIQIEVVQGLRTFKEQDELYAQGRTKPGLIVTRARAGQSEHNYGTACDVCPFLNGKPQWNDRKAFLTIGAEAQKLGLEWGGAWKKFVDLPHVQLNSPPIIRMYALYQQGGLPAVWSEVDKIGVK
jgi:hypothetical protein